MKKLIFFFLFIVFHSNCFSQFGGITKDPFNLAVNKIIKQINYKNLQETVESKKKLMDMLKVYNDWNENINIVNNIIKSSQTVIDIKNLSVKLGKNYNKNVSLINKQTLIESKDKSVLIEYYTIILNDGINELSEFNKIIGDGLKMNDYERLSLLKKIQDKLEYQLGLMNYFHNKVLNELNRRESKLKEKEFFKIKL